MSGWRIARALILFALLAAVATFCSLAWRQSVLLSNIQARISDEVVSARKSATQLRRVYGMVEDISRIAEVRRAPGVVQIWDELARILPDSTYLVELEVRESEIVATGFSDAAPSLIRLLEASEVIHGASFTGPVVQDRTKSKEQFSLRASLRQPRHQIDRVN